MKPIAILEFSAVFFTGIALIGQVSNPDRSKEGKWLRLTLLSVMLHLAVDALAYTLAGPQYPFALRYAVNFLTYTMSGIDMLAFIMYCNVFINSKIKVKRRTFRIPLIATGLCSLTSAALFLAGKLIVYENGVAVEVHDIPVWLRLFEILIMLYTPTVSVRFRKEIGWKAALLLGFYCFTPIISGVAAIYTGIDFSILIGAIAVLLVASVVQVEEQQKNLLGAMPLSYDVLAKANIGMWAFELDEGRPPRMYDDETMLGLVGLEHRVPPEEAYHAWYDHIDAGSYDLVTDAVSKMISGEHAEVQYPWHFPDGRTIIVRCGGVRNFEYTKGIRIEGTHQDVTQTLHFDEEQRKREEQQRNDEIARIKAEASDKAKTEFLFNMSHDIRTPMNAILGYTDIALNHIGETNRVQDSLKKIRTSGGHLLRLINDILEMSRIEAGRMEIIPAPLNIHEVTEGVVNMSEALAIAKEISFRAEIGELRNPYIYADELHTNQVIINLISNAVKYTNPGGSVEYRVEQLSDPEDGVANYRVTVKDNGIGMSEEFQKHLFESFSRENSVTVSKQEGAGLGLAIVKRIVDLMDGTVSVSSRQGEGSVFVVELPLRVMDDAAVRAFESGKNSERETDTDAALKGKRVLLVEDNEMNREIATEMLEDYGLTVECAEDGAIAVRRLREKGVRSCDFILMDIQMPLMNGYEATAEIRKLPDGDSVPIIALSANAFQEDVGKSLAAGMNAHVAKPIDMKELLAAMEKF